MRRQRKYILLFWYSILVVTFLCIVGCVIAQTPDSINLSDTIPLDNGVRFGKLPNGFTYYIRRNENPERKMSMHLIIKAGWSDEDSDQTELAHLLEHMAFNGTTHFSNAWDFLDKIGIKRGWDANAFTTFEETHYLFSIPSDNADTLQKGMLLLRDFAQGILLEPKAVDGERGVVLSEIRQSNGFVQRMEDQYNPLLKSNFRSTARRIDNINHFRYEALVRFYHDWYRPDLQGIVIVGDIDVEAIENTIKAMFSDLKSTINASERKPIDISGVHKNHFVIASDIETPGTEIRIYIKKEKHVCKTYEDLKISTIMRLYDIMMKSRFLELNNQYSPPFKNIRCSMGRTADADVLLTCIDVKIKKVKEGLISAFTELERVNRYGFTEFELDKAKRRLLDTFQPDNKISSQSLANRYHDHFLYGKASPDIEIENRLIRNFLQRITLEEVNSQSRDWGRNHGRDIVVLTSEKEKALLPDESTILNWLHDLKKEKIKPYHEGALDSSPAFSSKVQKNMPLKYKRTEIEEAGVTEVILDNGPRILLKPIQSADYGGEIRLNGFCTEGAQAYKDEDYFSALYAAEIIVNSGIAQLNKFQLGKLFSEKNLEVYPYIYNDQKGIRGHSNALDFEIMMQLVCEYMMAPVKSKIAFNDWINQRKSVIEYETSNPQQAFQSMINSSINYKYKNPPVLSDLRNITLDKVYKIYKKSFSNSKDFTFVITGDFDVDEIIPVVIKYLGSLSLQNKNEVNTNAFSQFKEDRITKTIYAGFDDDRASVELCYSGVYDFSPENNLTLDIISYGLQNALTERLREKEAGTYGVMVQVNYSKSSNSMYRFKIDFDCSPLVVEKMISAALEEIDYIRIYGIDSGIIRRFVATESRNINASLTDNAFWENYLTRQCQESREITEIFDRVKLLDQPSISNDNLECEARKYLNSCNRGEFVLLPKSCESKTP